jgi:hypothetical protein
MSSNNLQVIGIGLDEATFDLILSWAKEGYSVPLRDG